MRYESTAGYFTLYKEREEETGIFYTVAQSRVQPYAAHRPLTVERVCRVGGRKKRAACPSQKRRLRRGRGGKERERERERANERRARNPPVTVGAH